MNDLNQYLCLQKVFQQNMDGPLYREILAFDFFHFMAAKFDFDCILHQDNDSNINITVNM